VVVPNGSSITDRSYGANYVNSDSTIEMGYYSPFDGIAALQSDVDNKLCISTSTTTNTLHLFTVYNTSSDLKSKSFGEFSSYTQLIGGTVHLIENL
jgi:hypothetical protein